MTELDAVAAQFADATLAFDEGMARREDAVAWMHDSSNRPLDDRLGADPGAAGERIALADLDPTDAGNPRAPHDLMRTR